MHIVYTHKYTLASYILNLDSASNYLRMYIKLEAQLLFIPTLYFLSAAKENETMQHN